MISGVGANSLLATIQNTQGRVTELTAQLSADVTDTGSASSDTVSISPEALKLAASASDPDIAAGVSQLSQLKVQEQAAIKAMAIYNKIQQSTLQLLPS